MAGLPQGPAGQALSLASQPKGWQALTESRPAKRKGKVANPSLEFESLKNCYGNGVTSQRSKSRYIFGVVCVVTFLGIAYLEYESKFLEFEVM